MYSRKYHSFNHSLKLTKEKKYEANVRNGFYMWDFKSSMNTVQNINSVKEGKMYVPKFDEVRLGPCPKPPLKSFVIQEVQNELLKQHKRSSQMLELVKNGELVQSKQQIQDLERNFSLPISNKQSPDLQWLLNVLSTLNPKHIFFHKSYYPSNQELGGRGKVSEELNGEQDNFFQDLPMHITNSRFQSQHSSSFFAAQPEQCCNTVAKNLKSLDLRSQNATRVTANLQSIFNSQPNPISKQEEIDSLRTIIDQLQNKTYNSTPQNQILQKRGFPDKKNSKGMFSEQQSSRKQLKVIHQEQGFSHSKHEKKQVQKDKADIDENSFFQKQSNLFVPNSLSIGQTFPNNQQQPFFNFNSQNYISPTKVQMFEMRQFQIFQDPIIKLGNSKELEMLNQHSLKSNEQMNSGSKQFISNNSSNESCSSKSSEY